VTSIQAIPLLIALDQGGGLPKWSTHTYFQLPVKYHIDQISQTVYSYVEDGQDRTSIDYKASALPNELNDHFHFVISEKKSFFNLF